ncbi:MAG: MBL fold metallo-hydrolase [Candidatus Paceibacterota bacterium]
MSKNSIIIIILFLIVFDIFIWAEIFLNKPDKNTELYFLNVGQGDGELIVFPNNIKTLIDAGQANKAAEEFSYLFSPFNRYIDLVILTHPEIDHFGGLIDIMKRYKVGAFIFNGETKDSNGFSDLEKIIQENKIKTVVLSGGDKIKYLENYFDVLSPLKDSNSAATNENGLVLKLNSQNLKTLFAADIGEKTETDLIKKYGDYLKSDILKVAHHGSKFSSSDKFLAMVLPKISVFEVGKNSYGHPNDGVIERLKNLNSKIFRTDQDGTVKISSDSGKINIYQTK